MDDRELFTKFWTDESKTTRKVLARIPEGSDYRPDKKSRTAHEIAWQIAAEIEPVVYGVLTLSGRGDKDMDEVTDKLVAFDG